MDTTKTFIIAEVGSTHDGSMGNAKCAIEVAGECGADAVKFQVHLPEAETLRNAPMPSYFKGEPRFEYFERTGFSRDQWLELKAHSEERGMTFMSSPFSSEAVDLLESIGMENSETSVLGRQRVLYYVNRSAGKSRAYAHSGDAQ